MMHFGIFTLIAAIDAKQLRSSGIENLRLSHKGLAAALPDMQNQAADSVNSMVDNVMNYLPKPLRDRMNEEGLVVDIGVSPTVQATVTANMAGSFHDNNNAVSDYGTALRVNGGMVTAQFQNSLHNNNAAIGKGDVYRVNGAIITSPVGIPNGTKNATKHVAGEGGKIITSPFEKTENGTKHVARDGKKLSLRQTLSQTLTRNSSDSGKIAELKAVVQKIRAFAQSLGAGASDSDSSSSSPTSLINESYQGDGGSSVHRSATHFNDEFGYLKIKVDPSFKFGVVADMSGALYENNNAVSPNGQAKRVNGAAMVANFSGALYDNNVGSSSDGEVYRLNEIDLYGNVTNLTKGDLAKVSEKYKPQEEKVSEKAKSDKASISGNINEKGKNAESNAEGKGKKKENNINQKAHL